MDPNQIILNEIQDDIQVPGVADSGKGKTYARHIIYADGRETWEYRRYSGQGPENDPIVKIETLTNKDQAAKFKEQERIARTEQNQAERKVTRVYQGTDPTTPSSSEGFAPSFQGSLRRAFFYAPNPER